MSIVALAESPSSKVTANDLDKAVSACNFKITDEKERADYLLLLQSADALLQTIENEPDYIPPQLLPTETVEPRTYSIPEKKDNPLKAWSHRCELRVKSPTSSLLQGRTVALKDNISVGGLPTTIGTFPQLFANDDKYPISPIDSTVVRRLLEAGAIVKGTATCENFSACPLSYSSATGPVHNPWLEGYNAGGSSSGPGALVAANMLEKKGHTAFGETVEMAIGGDQGGSIRLPASYCGIYGLKATHGLIPYTGTANLFPMIDHIGPMASSVRDIALLLQAIAGYDGFDSKMTAESPLCANVKDYSGLLDSFLASHQHGKAGQNLRIGILKEGFNVPKLATSVRGTVYEAAVKHFTEAGADVKEVSVPMHTLGPAIWTAATRISMADIALVGQGSGHLAYSPPHIKFKPIDQEFYDLLTATNPAVPNLVIAGQHLKTNFGPYAEAKAQRKVYELRAAYDEVFKDIDILITPTTPTVAMPHPKMKLTDPDGQGSTVMEKLSLSVGSTTNTCPFNVTGHPAMSVPCGFVSAEENGVNAKLPVGMQLIARRWDEETLLQAAAIFEAQMVKH